VYENSVYAEQLTKLYEATLPLDEMAGGMGNYLFAAKLHQEDLCLDFVLQELRKYPGMGEGLVRTALRSPVVGKRYSACLALKAWEELSEQSLESLWPEIVSLLAEIAPTEVILENRKAMRKLLKKQSGYVAQKRRLEQKRLLFLAPQTFLLAAVLFLLDFVRCPSEQFLTSAYTAREVLEGYLAWSRAMFWFSVAAGLLIFVGSIALLCFAGAKGILGIRHLLFATVGIVFVFVTIFGLPSISARAIREDIRSIERNERGAGIPATSMEFLMHEMWHDHQGIRRLGVRRVNLDPEALAPPLSSGRHPTLAPRVVYRSSLADEPYALYFPRAFAPAYLRNLAEGEAEGVQLFEIRYTPNLLVVVEARPIGR